MAEAKQDQPTAASSGSASSSAASANQPRQQQSQASSGRRDNSGQDYDPTQGVGDEMSMRHTQRVTVPGARNVDARLDNRFGAQRPPLEEFPAKPQQVDGPDIAGQIEHTARALQSAEDKTPRKGMYSPGPYGLSDNPTAN